MKRVLAIIIIFLMSLCFLGCVKTKNENEYKKEYEELINQIDDRFGEYLTVDVDEFENNINIRLNIEKYLQNKEKQRIMPAYVLIEDTRVMVNEYLDSNPNCRLAKLLQEKDGYIMLYKVYEYFGSSQSKSIFKVETNFRDEIKRFNQYSVIDIQLLNELCSIDNNDYDYYNDYIKNMNDYFALTGSDIDYIVILDKVVIKNADQEAWREEVKSKFPLIVEEGDL